MLTRQVMAISTDYRDSRKAAYQQYAVVSDFNACRVPDGMDPTNAAPLGVAFVAAALALGICMGMDFGRGNGPRGPHLLRTVQSLPRDALPKDIQKECFDSIQQREGAKAGDWIAIWGGKRPWTFRHGWSLTIQAHPQLAAALCSLQNLLV